MKLKKIIVFLLILISIISISVISNASFLGNFTGNVNTESAERVGSVASSLLGVIQVISISVAIIMLMILGIKYMLASAADRAEIKKHAVVYVVGAVIMFGAAGFVQIIKIFSSQIGV